MVDYPDKFLKGIPNSEKLGGDNAPTADIFYFPSESIGRNDNYVENSINWNDDEGSAEILLSQKKATGEIQFKAGFAIMCRHQLDRILTLPLTKNVLSYERRELEQNKYHGNLLLDKSIKSREMKKIAATIALTCFEEWVPNQ